MTRRRRPQRSQPLPDPRRDDPIEANPELRAAILAIVDKQLSDGTPPETRATLDRLVAGGHTPEGARQLIATVVVHEIVAVMQRGEAYNEARYLAALRRLPTLPAE
jgi:hypothetical protein